MIVSPELPRTVAHHFEDACIQLHDLIGASSGSQEIAQQTAIGDNVDPCYDVVLSANV